MNKIDGIKCQDNYKIIFVIMCIEECLNACCNAVFADPLLCVICCQDTSSSTTDDMTNDKKRNLLGQPVENPIARAPSAEDMIR